MTDEDTQPRCTCCMSLLDAPITRTCAGCGKVEHNVCDRCWSDCPGLESEDIES